MNVPRSRGEAPALPWQRWLPGVLALGMVAAHVVRSSLQQDFSAFFMAGRALAAGRNPYLNDAVELWDGVAVFHHSRFLYPPLFAFCMRGLAALPYFVAKGVFTSLSLACWVVALQGLSRVLALRPTGQRWAVAVGVCFPPVWLTLERGQTDLIALALMIHAWTHRERSWRAGAFVALAVFVKPVLLPAWLALLVGRQVRTALVALGFLVGGLLLGAVVAGGPLTKAYFTEVVPRIAQLGEGGGAAELLTEDELAAREARLDDEERILVEGRAYAPEPVAILRSANLSRLLAPHGPSALGLLAPPVLFLAWLGYVFRPRRSGPWVWAACPVATVLCSPTGWAMSLTWALPLLLLGVARLQDASLDPKGAVPRLLVAGVLMTMLGPWLTGAWVLAGLSWVAAASVAPESEGQRS